MADHESQIVDFCGLSGASPEEARQYLEAHNWDMAEASNAWFRDAEEDGRDTSTAPAAPDNYTGPRTLDGRPAPEASGSSSQAARKPVSQQKKKGIATLGSLGGGSHQHDHGDDDEDDFDPEDDDGRGNLFAGGEKSGLAVQDPKQEGGPKKIINDILAKARASNASRSDPENEAGPSQPSRFRGTGQTLGGDGVESRSIPDPLGPSRPSNAQPQERVLHIWQDGFSIDDGELRRFDDPANQADLAMIRSGRAPLHLMNVQHDQPVDVKLHQHDTPYQPQPKQYKPFGGSGRRLGAVMPGATEEASGSTAAPAAAASSSSSTAPSVDSSQPTIMIRIQMPDGTRLPARFNTTHTVDDIYGFVQGASPDTRTRPWVLATTFPNKDHTDRSLVLGEMAEFKKGGTAVVKWT
ncbi:SEP domain-containing [Fusarium albosuccineum]|uniref:SEP domain-containing n=1 Tax=Fusarium albosuccineum TaxID=1237068 RepID=A0A8H4LK81_9HYPO|nr:SEP domain-containing [Fusarium albosuccineum]